VPFLAEKWHWGSFICGYFDFPICGIIRPKL